MQDSKTTPVIELSEQFKDALLTKIIDHIMENLNRYWRVRFWLYGFYFAMISALLGFYFSGNLVGEGADDKTDKLFLFAAAIGQLCVLIQIIISFLIRGAYDSLALFFNQIKSIRILNQISLETNSHWTSCIVNYPYSPLLFFLFLINIALFLRGFFGDPPKWNWVEVWFDSAIYLLLLFVIFSLLSVFHYFLLKQKEVRQNKIIHKEFSKK
ncbi:hypothetical protein KKB18_05330 [bacterium]|nr:hypothetical protein [bacterium]